MIIVISKVVILLIIVIFDDNLTNDNNGNRVSGFSSLFQGGQQEPQNTSELQTSILCFTQFTQTSTIVDKTQRSHKYITFNRLLCKYFFIAQPLTVHFRTGLGASGGFLSCNLRVSPLPAGITKAVAAPVGVAEINPILNEPKDFTRDFL